MERKVEYEREVPVKVSAKVPMKDVADQKSPQEEEVVQQFVVQDQSQ